MRLLCHMGILVCCSQFTPSIPQWSVRQQLPYCMEFLSDVLYSATQKTLLTDFLGRLQPSKTTTQKTRGTLGVEESSSPRRVLHFHSSNASTGRIRAELWGFKVISKGYPCELVFRNQLSFSPEGPDLGFKGRSLVTQMNPVSGTQGETMPERG